MAEGTPEAAAAELARPAAPQAVSHGEPADRVPAGAASAVRVAALLVAEGTPEAEATEQAPLADPAAPQAMLDGEPADRAPAGAASAARVAALLVAEGTPEAAAVASGNRAAPV